MRRRARLAMGLSGARILGVTALSVLLYATLPLERADWLGWRLFLGLLALAAVVAWEIRVIVRSDHPTVRGVEAILVSAPLLVLMHASAYVRSSLADPEAFTEPLGRLDAAYLAVTVFSTVGFGDITPLSDAARTLVMTQMLVDLAFIGFVAKVLVAAVRLRRDVLAADRPALTAAGGPATERLPPTSPTS